MPYSRRYHLVDAMTGEIVREVQPRAMRRTRARGSVQHELSAALFVYSVIVTAVLALVLSR